MVIEIWKLLSKGEEVYWKRSCWHFLGWWEHHVFCLGAVSQVCVNVSNYQAYHLQSLHFIVC